MKITDIKMVKVSSVYKENPELWEKIFKAKRAFKTHCEKYEMGCKGCKYSHDLESDCEELFYKDWSVKNDK